MYKRFTFHIWQPVLHTVIFKTCGSYNGHSLQPKYVAAAKWIVQLVANNPAYITQLHGTCTILNSFMQIVHTTDVIRYKRLCRRLICIAFSRCNYEPGTKHHLVVSFIYNTQHRQVSLPQAAIPLLLSFTSLEGYLQNQNLTEHSHHESETFSNQ
jgi:hypothetical protein